MDSLETNQNLEPVEVSFQPKATKEEVIERLKEIAQDAEDADKQELDSLKQNFYKIYKSEQETARKDFVEKGGDVANFVPEANTAEADYKAVMNVIKEKRNEILQEQERQKEQNLILKQHIIDRMKALVANPEEANKSYNEVKQLQQQWKDIKLVPATMVNELWKTYQHYIEQYYDILKLNNEFREYDFKKNLEIKTKLCEAAEKLADEPDVVSAFHQLQKLHQEFREAGPVSKDLRDEIWNRFKAASTIVNRRHQQHFEDIKQSEQKNLDEKTVICEIVESMNLEDLKKFAEWDAKTKEVLALQAKWKTIGFAPQKMNVKIFERFRQACDNFFSQKAGFYKSVKEEFTNNLEKKKDLCEKAEALKENTDWKETSKQFVKIQQEWKTIGPVPKKYSESLWKRFIEACDYFFEQKGKATSSQHNEESANLGKKLDIITRLTVIDVETNSEEAIKTVRALMNEWNAVGHVPFKEKDKIFKQYHTLIDNLFDSLNMSASKQKLNNFKSGLSKDGNLNRERDKLVRQYEMMKNDIKTYENNLGFLSASSKKGNSLVTEMQRKVEKLKSELELVSKKIKMIDDTSGK